MTLATILSLLPKVGPIIAAAPEFKALIEELISALEDDRDQAELRIAYENAISDAEHAHEQLQGSVARRGSLDTSKDKR